MTLRPEQAIEIIQDKINTVDMSEPSAYDYIADCQYAIARIKAGSNPMEELDNV